VLDGGRCVRLYLHKFQAVFVDSGKVHQGISIWFGIAAVLQCTARYRRYLQVKLNGVLQFALAYGTET